MEDGENGERKWCVSSYISENCYRLLTFENPSQGEPRIEYDKPCKTKITTLKPWKKNRFQLFLLK